MSGKAERDTKRLKKAQKATVASKKDTAFRRPKFGKRSPRTFQKGAFSQFCNMARTCAGDDMLKSTNPYNAVAI